MIFAFELIVLIFSVMIHEISHGVVAERLGDPTARLAGRLTLNPLRHIDPVGSILLPLLLALPALFGQPTIIFGWAKPVPYDPRNLKNPKTGGAKIAAAGPISNLLIAVIFGLLFRGLVSNNPDSSLLLFFAIIILLNISLAVFNLIPLPPLDGSKVLFAYLPPREWSYGVMRFLEQYSLVLLLLLVIFGFSFLSPVVGFLFHLITGQPF